MSERAESWQVAGPTEHAGLYYVDVMTAEGIRLGRFHIGNDPNAGEHARLIAAAPDLLAALKEARRWWTLGGPPGTVEMMDAAIAKAIGT